MIECINCLPVHVRKDLYHSSISLTPAHTDYDQGAETTEAQDNGGADIALAAREHLRHLVPLSKANMILDVVYRPAPAKKPATVFCSQLPLIRSPLLYTDRLNGKPSFF